MILQVLMWVLIGVGIFMSYGIGIWAYDQIDMYFERRKNK